MNCLPQLLAFDLYSDRLILQVPIPEHLSKNKDGLTFLAWPVISTLGQRCEYTAVRKNKFYKIIINGSHFPPKAA